MCVSVNASLQYPPHCVYDRLRKIYIRSIRIKCYLHTTYHSRSIIIILYFYFKSRVHLHSFSHGIKIPNSTQTYAKHTLLHAHNIPVFSSLLPNEPIRTGV